MVVDEAKFTAPDAYKLVVVALVNIAVEAPVEPIGVLLIVPASIVRPSITIDSVIELFGKLTEPETYKLVDVTAVPLTLVKVKPPDKVPPANGK